MSTGGCTGRPMRKRGSECPHFIDADAQVVAVVEDIIVAVTVETVILEAVILLVESRLRPGPL